MSIYTRQVSGECELVDYNKKRERMMSREEDIAYTIRDRTWRDKDEGASIC